MTKELGVGIIGCGNISTTYFKLSPLFKGVKVVACDSADAQYSVLGIVEKQSQISARMGACKAFPETTSVYWQGRDTKSGTVYCLKKL